MKMQVEREDNKFLRTTQTFTFDYKEVANILYIHILNNHSHFSIPGKTVISIDACDNYDGGTYPDRIVLTVEMEEKIEL